MKQVKKILISQPRPQVERNPYSGMENDYGVQCDFHQLIKVEGIGVREFRDQHIYLEDYTAVIVNSRLGIDHYFRMAEEMRFSVPESMHYYCISEAVGNYLQKYIQYRKRKVFAAENNRFEDLLPAMHRRPQEKYLMVMSDVHNEETLNMFAENNIVVTNVSSYTEAVTMVEKYYAKVDSFEITLLEDTFLHVSDYYRERIMTGEIEEEEE